jgi:hypothetical protein
MPDPTIYLRGLAQHVYKCQGLIDPGIDFWTDPLFCKDSLQPISAHLPAST